MSYFKLQLKRVLKSKFTWISLLIILLCCLFFLRTNYISSTSDRQELVQAKANLVTQTKNVKFFQRELKRNDLDAESKKQVRKNLVESKSDVRKLKILVRAFKNNDWETAYPIMIKDQKYSLKNAKRNSLSKSLVTIMQKDLLQLEILAKYHIPKEVEYASTKGGFFVLQMMQEILPPLTVLAVIFILTKLYSAGYFERMRLGNLLPQQKLVLTEFYTGSFVGFSYFLLAFLLIFLIPSLFFGTGSFNYPVTCMNPVAKKYIFKSMYQLFLPILFMELLSFIFIAAAVLLIVQLLKNRLLALLTSALLLVGGMVIPQYVIAVRNFAQYLPTTYFFALQPVDGLFGISNAYTFADENQLITYPRVNFTNGIIVLALGIAILIVFNFFIAKSAQKGIKTK